MKKESLRPFIDLCLKAKNADKLEQLLDLFLTLEEKEMVVSRYQILHALLKTKLTQREIASKFGLSIAQITRGSNALKIIGKDLSIFLEENL